MTSATSLLQTPLYPAMQALNARMTEFSGWEMPVQFSGIKEEHAAVRTQAGMFDISHMGKFLITGTNVLADLQTLVPSDLSRLRPGRAQYTVLLNPHGGIIDDLIFYYQGLDAAQRQRWVVIVNAATRRKDKAWILGHLDGDDVDFQDVTTTQALLAVQGPDAAARLQSVVADDLGAVPVFGHLTTTIAGQPAFIARTGYTGEDGFEVMVPAEVGADLWRSLLEAGVTPCGLGARDTLRLEAALALYGQDINDQTTPLEAGLGWLVHLDRKDDFIGRAVLAQQKEKGVPRKLVGLKMTGRAIARHDYRVFHADEPVGTVTSGTQSPTLGAAIALAYVPPELSQPGQSLAVEIRGKLYPATVVKRPFYRSANRP